MSPLMSDKLFNQLVNEFSNKPDSELATAVDRHIGTLWENDWREIQRAVQNKKRNATLPPSDLSEEMQRKLYGSHAPPR